VKEIQAVPTTYGGTTFRSALEADWACTLNHYGLDWQYEPWTFELPSGAWYLPDFWLPALHTFVEVKGAHMQRLAKTEELAKEVNITEATVLIGFQPLRRSTTPYLWDPYLQWRDPLGYDMRFARCPGCSAWQWMRAYLSRRCCLCGDVCTGFLAKAGELPFMIAQPDGPAWLGVH
jgi:hypothetical protein